MLEWFGSGWFWLSLAALLLALEALAPGALMLWFGLAAIATAGVVALTPLGPTAQWIVFSVLALVSAAIGWQLRKRRPLAQSDRPMLNQRTLQLVGEVHPLETAIVNGRGRLKIGDTFWTVEGSELPAGTPVRIISADSGVLYVASADPAHQTHMLPP